MADCSLLEKPTLQTGRLILRPLRQEDVPALRRWLADPRLYPYWGKGPGKADKDPTLLFAKAEKPTKSFHLGLQERESGLVIGELWVYCIEYDRMAKVAYRIAPDCQGKGYATEALGAMVEYCFGSTPLRRLWAEVDVRNPASCRVLEKCGFTREGKIRQGKMVSSWCDYYLYGLLREDLPGNRDCPFHKAPE